MNNKAKFGNEKGHSDFKKSYKAIEIALFTSFGKLPEAQIIPQILAGMRPKNLSRRTLRVSYWKNFNFLFQIGDTRMVHKIEKTETIVFKIETQPAFTSGKPRWSQSEQGGFSRRPEKKFGIVFAVDCARSCS